MTVQVKRQLMGGVRSVYYINDINTVILKFVLFTLCYHFKLLINTYSEIKIRNHATFLYHAFKKRNSQQ